MKRWVSLAVAILTMALPMVSRAESALPSERASAAAGDSHSSFKNVSKPSVPALVVHQQLDADVSHVDRDTGVLLLRTGAGRLTLDAAARATDVLSKGDRVVLDITVLRHPDPARISRGDKPQAPLLVRRLPAHVAAVQRSVGIVSLKTSAGWLNVNLPPATLVNLHTDDELWLDVTVLQASDATSPRLESRRRAGVLGFVFGIFGGARGGGHPGP